MAQRDEEYHLSMEDAGFRPVTSQRCRGEFEMSAIRPTTVEVETSLRLVAPDSTALAVRASLRYDPADPYAVHVLFHAESAGGEAVSWSFARELLVTGLDEPAGIGDVRVWPWNTPRGEFVALALSSPDGNALFEVPRSVLVRFLRRTRSEEHTSELQ